MHFRSLRMAFLGNKITTIDTKNGSGAHNKHNNRGNFYDSFGDDDVSFESVGDL